MAYDDGYYYGQCKIVAVVDNTADDGKTVLITTDDNKTYSGTIANKKCEFLLPPRTLYTVQKVSSGSAEFTTKVEAGYGDCILVHLDTGYVEVKQGDIVGLDYIKAATNDNLKNKVPEAKAVKELNSSLTKVKTYVGSDGKLHFVDAKGADSVLPFSGSNKYIDSSIQVRGGMNETTTNDYSVVVPSNVKTCTIFSSVFAFVTDGYPATIQIYKNGIQITPNFTYTYCPSYHYLIAIAVIDVLEGDTIRLFGSNTGASASGVNAVAHCLVWS